MKYGFAVLSPPRAILSQTRISHGGKEAAASLRPLPCPVGARGAAGVRVRRCLPCGAKALQSWRADFGRFTGKSFLRGVLPIRKLSRRAGERETEPSYIFQRGGDVCRLTGGTRPSPGKIFHIILPPQTRHSTRRASSPTIPRGERRALPAPAQGIHPLRIPFWGTAAVSPRLPSPNHRLLPPSPRPNRTAAHPPPARGAGVRRIRANGTGRRHCRLLIFGAFCCKMK